MRAPLPRRRSKPIIKTEHRHPEQNAAYGGRGLVSICLRLRTFQTKAISAQGRSKSRRQKAARHSDRANEIALHVMFRIPEPHWSDKQERPTSTRPKRVQRAREGIFGRLAMARACFLERRKAANLPKVLGGRGGAI